MPTALSGLIVLLCRPWFGELRRAGDTTEHLRFTLLDALSITTLAGASTAWFSYVANIPLVAANANVVSDVIPIQPLLLSALWSAAMSLTVTWMMFSCRLWYLGFVAFAIVLALRSRTIEPSSLWLVAYWWCIALITLTMFRYYGYRLMRAGMLPTSDAAEQ
jgi:hypothetical protein